jgi:hypothetical protein
VALRAPPSPFGTTSGFSSCDLTPATKASGDPLLEFASSSEPDRVSAALAPVSRRAACATRRGRPSPGFASLWGSCSLEHVYAGCPFSPPPQPHGHGRVGEGRQAFTGAVLRVLAPLDGSGCACGTHELRLKNSPSPCAPTLRGLVSCRSRPLESPYRAFPSRGAVPALAGLCFLASSRSTRPTTRHGPRCSRPLSPIAPTTRHGWPCGSPDSAAGTTAPRSR